MEGSIARKNEVPPFLIRTYYLVDDPSTDSTVSWSRNNKSLIVWSPIDFAENLLPKHFKHSNFSSFVRQLNHYGFRKVHPDLYEFAHKKFIRFQPHLLRQITRKKADGGHRLESPRSLNPTAVVGNFGLKEEMERFKCDKDTILIEVVKLKQQHQASRRMMQMINQRLHRSHKLEQQMMAFLGKIVESPELLAQLLLQNQPNNRRDLRGAISGQEKSNSRSEPSGPEGQIVKFQANHEGFVQLTSCAELPATSEKMIGKGSRNVCEEVKVTGPQPSGNTHLSTGQDDPTVDSTQISASKRVIWKDTWKDLTETSDSAFNGEMIHCEARDVANHSKVPDSDSRSIPPSGGATLTEPSVDVLLSERVNESSAMEGVEVVQGALHSATGNEIEKVIFNCFDVTVRDKPKLIEVPDHDTQTLHVTDPNKSVVRYSSKVLDQTNMDSPDSNSFQTPTSIELDSDIDSLLESLPSLQVGNDSDLLKTLLQSMELESVSSDMIEEGLDALEFQNLSNSYSSLGLSSFNYSDMHMDVEDLFAESDFTFPKIVDQGHLDPSGHENTTTPEMVVPKTFTYFCADLMSQMCH